MVALASAGASEVGGAQAVRSMGCGRWGMPLGPDHEGLVATVSCLHVFLLYFSAWGPKHGVPRWGGILRAELVRPPRLLLPLSWLAGWA